jgi:hypothetical protein
MSEKYEIKPVEFSVAPTELRVSEEGTHRILLMSMGCQIEYPTCGICGKSWNEHGIHFVRQGIRDEEEG